MVYGMNKQARGEAGGAQVGIQVGLLNLWEGKYRFLVYSMLIYHTEKGRKLSTSSFSVSSSWYNFPNLRFAASSSDMSEFSGSL